MAEGGWLSYVLAAAVTAVSVFCIARLGVAALCRRSTERDADVVHVVMGVSMAAMLTGWLGGRWDLMWTSAFVLATAWFGWGVARELRGTGQAHCGSHLPHLVASAAMLYMLLATAWGGAGGGTGSLRAPRALGMSMPASHPSATTLALSVLVAVLLVGDAALVVARSFATSQSSLLRPVGAAGEDPVNPLAAVDTPGDPDTPRVLVPRATPLCLLVMSLAMAYMFVTMAV